MKGRRNKRILLAIASILIALPLVLSFTRLNRVIPLKGDVQITPKPEFNVKSWLDGRFQGQFEKYVNDNIGFGPWFVRVRNQITYSLYGKLADTVNHQKPTRRFLTKLLNKLPLFHDKCLMDFQSKQFSNPVIV